MGLGNANNIAFTEGSYTVAVCLWITEEAPLVHCFLKSIDMLLATFEKDGSPSCTIPGCTNAYFNYGVDPLHPDHSMNCRVVATHVPTVPSIEH